MKMTAVEVPSGPVLSRNAEKLSSAGPTYTLDIGFDMPAKSAVYYCSAVAFTKILGCVSCPKSAMTAEYVDFAK